MKPLSRQLLPLAFMFILVPGVHSQANAQTRTGVRPRSDTFSVSPSHPQPTVNRPTRGRHAELSSTDVANFQTNLNTLVTWLVQTSSNSSNTSLQSTCNDLQQQVSGLTSDQVSEMATYFDVNGFANAVNTLATVQASPAPLPPTDPPANLSIPDYGDYSACVPHGFQTSDPPIAPSDPSTQHALLIEIDVAKSAMIFGDKACDTIVEIAGEGTNVPTCIIAAVVDELEAALEQTKAHFEFCDSGITSAQVQSTFLNTQVIDFDIASLGASTTNQTTVLNDHLTALNAELDSHTSAIDADIDNHVAAVDADLNNHLTNEDADLNNHLTANDTDLNNHLNGVDTDLTTRATQIDNEISTFQSLDLRLRIEQSLSSGQPVGLFELPKADGGYLELVRSIVVDTINKMLAAGLSVGTASKSLSNGDAAFTAGQFKTAFADYASAYQAAVH